MREINLSNSENLNKIDNLSKKFLNKKEEDAVIMAEQNLAFPYLNVINQAIFENLIINFNYHSISKDVLSSRRVSPHKIYLQNGNLYLSGYDLQAHSDRVFKADQIVDCTIGDRDHPEKTTTPQQEEIVELIIDRENINFIERNSTIIVDQEITNGQLHVKLRVSNFDWLKRAILSNAPSIKVISPESLASEVQQMAFDLISAYSEQG